MNPDIESLPLRDIHLPEPVSWWPPAIGWWIVAGLVLLLMAAVYIVRTIHKRRQLKRAALAEFNAIVERYRQHHNAQWLLNQLSILLRRLSVTTSASGETAGLTGRAWLEFLDSALRQANQKAPARFCSDIGEQLITVPYRKKPSIDRHKVDSLIELCRQWVSAVSRRGVRPPATQGGV